MNLPCAHLSVKNRVQGAGGTRGIRSVLTASTRKVANRGSRIPEPLLVLTPRGPLKVQISQGMCPFFQIELLKTGRTDYPFMQPLSIIFQRESLMPKSRSSSPPQDTFRGVQGSRVWTNISCSNHRSLPCRPGIFFCYRLRQDDSLVKSVASER